MTIRHLLNHTGGLAAYDEGLDLRRDYTEEELVRDAGERPAVFEPGTAWSYSNTGYMVLGALVSRLTGAHWSEFLRERVFLPAGMETARVISEAEIVPHRSSGYRLEEGWLLNQEWVSPTMLSTGDGALYFSILDLVKWDQALHTDVVLSAESRRAMWEPTRLADGPEVGYGFGWEVIRSPAVAHVGHGGAWQGFKTYILRYVDPVVTVAVLTNAAHANPQALAYEIAAAYRPELTTPLPEPRRLAPELASDYTGIYLLPAGDTARVEVGAEGLLLRVPWGAIPLAFIGDDAFRLAERSQHWYERLLRFARRDGEVVEAWLGPPGASHVRIRRVR